MRAEEILIVFLGLFLIITETLCKRENDEWNEYKILHNKKYNVKTDAKRFNIFMKNKNKITAHNQKWESGESSFKVVLNQFGDMDETHMKERNGLKYDKNIIRASTYYGFSKPLGAVHEDLPPSVDWRDKDIVSPVIDQGSCASCWSFSSIGAIESQLAKKNGELIPLSGQYLIDCCPADYGNFGCKGGQPENAFQFMKAKGCIIAEENYPYNASQGQCKTSNDNDKLAPISGFNTIPYGDEIALKKAVSSVGPICAGIDASQWTLQCYSHGVYNDVNCSSSNLDHAVLIVGYGEENNLDYWLVKNTWGINWGEKGYVKMIRNHNNQCGIASLASYPLV